MVETGYVTCPIRWKRSWQEMKTVMLPPNGPLTAEKGTAMAIPFYARGRDHWLACMNGYSGLWQPAFYNSGKCITLNIQFDTQDECEDFIIEHIFSVSELGSARVTPYYYPGYGEEYPWVSLTGQAL